MTTTILTNKQIIRAFPRLLEGNAARWYYYLPLKTRGDWNELSTAFMNQYGCSSKLEVTLRDLEMAKQKPGKAFSEFLARWLDKAALLKEKPSEKDRVRIVVRNVFPHWVERLQNMNPKTFEDLLDDGMQVEEIESEKKHNAPTGGYLSNYQSANKSASVNFVQRQGPVGRKFSEFPIPLTKTPGHYTDSCITLKHAIQDLIDDGRITDPSIGQPSTQKNPLPNYHAIRPSKGVNTINFGLTYEEVMNSFVDTDPTNSEKPVVAEAPPIAGPLTALFRQLKSQGLINHPPLNGKLCEYHRDFGHSTEECVELKELVRTLIAEGKVDSSL
ncbi:uncharacterized protein LOC126668275 [Mercurialis annua]|uniref:uncharacterized protein LOC126668275 n=1 Tax=Mercurialis annua TaxID=3986 RepID=UPI00215FF24F|nr:uncharacterized protein LOC126668275 [Mercurialis annua]